MTRILGRIRFPCRPSITSERLPAGRYSDPAIQRWHCRSLDVDEAAATIRRWREAWETETGASWAVADRERRVLGRVGFRELHLADGVAEVAYWVLASARAEAWRARR